jgi:hypothetical protein
MLVCGRSGIAKDSEPAAHRRQRTIGQATCGSSCELCLLERVRDWIPLPCPDLGSFLADLVFNEYLASMFSLELPDESGIPKFAGHS